MKLLLLLPLVFLSLITPAFAEIDLTDQRLISLDGNIVIEFGQNTYDFTKNTVKITPNIEFGILQLEDGTVFVDNARTNVLANSFSIALENGKIYAKNNGDGNFDIKILTAENGKFKKEYFQGILEPRGDNSFEKIKITEPIVAEEKPVTDLLMLGKYSQVTAINDQINFDIRVFDSTLNPLKDYNANYGYIENADVTIAIKDSQNKILWFIEDKTNEFGYSEIEFRVENNYLLIGEFSANITIQYEGNLYEKTVPIFIEQSNADAFWLDFLKI